MLSITLLLVSKYLCEMSGDAPTRKRIFTCGYGAVCIKSIGILVDRGIGRRPRGHDVLLIRRQLAIVLAHVSDPFIMIP